MASIPDLFKETGEALTNLEHRPFDRFLLGPFLIWYGLKSKTMGRWPRRVLIAGGLYQLLYAYKDYKKLAASLKEGPSSTIAVISNNDTLPIEELIL